MRVLGIFCNSDSGIKQLSCPLNICIGPDNMIYFVDTASIRIPVIHCDDNLHSCGNNLLLLLSSFDL